MRPILILLVAFLTACTPGAQQDIPTPPIESLIPPVVNLTAEKNPGPVIHVFVALDRKSVV